MWCICLGRFFFAFLNAARRVDAHVTGTAKQVRPSQIVASHFHQGFLRAFFLSVHLESRQLDKITDECRN